MQLETLNITDLTVSKTNVRKSSKAKIAKTLDDLISSIRSLGVLQPLLVREGADSFEIVAGQRRYHACVALAEEDKTFAEVPCMVMDAGDDAKAIEASLAENIARLPMDEIDQYKAFAALVKEGRTAEDIASQFGVTERLVTQRLAIANLIPPILNAYRRDEIDAGDMRILTMSTRRQQKAWWVLVNSKDWAPTGRALKHWLFGGATIPESNAMFDVEASGLTLIGDLFGQERYFADSARFWPAQSAAVAEKAATFEAKGWPVIVHEIGDRWQSWNYKSVSRKDGGEVHITIASDGEVSVHEGVLDRDVLRKRKKAEESTESKPAKPEITKAMQNYLALHRHVAVRSDLMMNLGIALRVMTAHIVAGSGLWNVQPEPQRCDKEATRESLAARSAQAAFEKERQEVARILGIDNLEDVAGRGGDWYAGRSAVEMLSRCLRLSDEETARAITFLMAETLEADSAVVEYLGQVLGTDPAAHWAPDDAFFDLLRDKAVINAMVAEAAGKSAAKTNLTATAKVQKGIMRDALSGKRTGGDQNWKPRYMAFPMQAYTERGGIRAIDLVDELPNVDEAKAEAA